VEDHRILRQDCGQAVLNYVSRLRAACLAFLGCNDPPHLPASLRSIIGAFVRAADILGAYRPVGLHEACAHGFQGLSELCMGLSPGPAA